MAERVQELGIFATEFTVKSLRPASLAAAIYIEETCQVCAAEGVKGPITAKLTQPDIQKTGYQDRCQ